MSGADKLFFDQQAKGGGGGGAGGGGAGGGGAGRPSGLKKGFVAPYKRDEPTPGGSLGGAPSMVKRALAGPDAKDGKDAKEELPERLKGCDPKLVEMIMQDMMDHSPGVGWDDIAGLEFAKKSVMEIVVWPLLRPDIFTGLRGPPKGLLLFGPPGTGKTLIGKAIASEARARFFSISASSLTSKWHGEGEKLVRTLFAVAACYQPSVIFIDEIDSLLSQRSDSEFEGSRRLKTEFLIQLDGAATLAEERVLVVGATNRPQELDEAARRRLVKRLYISLPGRSARRQLLLSLLRTEKHDMGEADIECIVDKSEGYSGADLRALCTEAAFGPIRSVADITRIEQANVRPMQLRDFEAGLQQVRASVNKADLQQYVDWNATFGSFPSEVAAPVVDQ